MGAFGIFKSTQSKNEEIQDNKQVNIQIGAEEEETVAGQINKKYCYMVVDKDNNVILGKSGKPFFHIIDEGEAPEWPIEWPQDIVSIAQLDEELRVEVKAVPEGLLANEKKKAKQRIIEDAKKKLLKMGEERIAVAKEIQNQVKNHENNTEQVIASKTQEAPKTSTEEKTGNTKLEVTSSAVESAENPETFKDNKKMMSNVELSEVTICVEKNVKWLSEDMQNDVDDLIQIIGSNGIENAKDIKSYVEAQSKRICDTTMRVASDAVRDISQKTQKYAENIVSRVNENGRSIGESQDKLLSKVNTVGKRVTELGESVEGIEGNLHRLTKLDEIADLLRDKGLNMSRDIPPVNADEEDIINLVRYSQKITEQLGYAARDLIRKQEAFKRQGESNANEQCVMEQRIAKAHDEGVEEGKKAFIKQLLSKYENIDTIRESDENYVHAIWTLLTELGVLIDGEGYYEKGKEIELTDSDIEKMMGTYSKLEDAGKYRVIRTGLCFQGEILCKAAFEKVVETEAMEVEALEDTIKEVDGSEQVAE